MRVALLTDPEWPDVARAAAYVRKLAEKHPDAVVVSAGIGRSVYETERAALVCGLRVAAFRQGTPPPSGVQHWSAPGPEEPYDGPTPPHEPRLVELHELVPGNPDHLAVLSSGDARIVATGLHGEDEGKLTAIRLAAASADEVVVFSKREGWPAAWADGPPPRAPLRHVGLS